VSTLLVGQAWRELRELEKRRDALLASAQESNDAYERAIRTYAMVAIRGPSLIEILPGTPRVCARLSPITGQCR
jgi:hypothetical protein